MIKTPEISLVIPVYNVSKYIEKSILSVLNQTWKGSLEIIVVDDCSPDASIDILQQVVRQHSVDNLKIITHPFNQGISATRNTGMKAAIGEYVFFLDSDDEMMPEALEKLYKKAKETNADFVCGEYQTVIQDTGKVELSRFTEKNGDILVGNYQIFEKRVLNDWSLTSWNKLIKRNFLMDNRLFFCEGIYYEDILWSINVANKAQKVAFIPDIAYIYNLHQGSISTSMGKKHIESFFAVVKNLFEYILSEKLFDQYGDLTLKLFEQTKNQAVDWTIPIVSVDTGKMIIRELQKYNIVSLMKIWSTNQLNLHLKMKSTAFYLGGMGYSYIKILSRGGKFFK